MNNTDEKCRGCDRILYRHSTRGRYPAGYARKRRFQECYSCAQKKERRFREFPEEFIGIDDPETCLICAVVLYRGVEKYAPGSQRKPDQRFNGVCSQCAERHRRATPSKRGHCKVVGYLEDQNPSSGRVTSNDYLFLKAIRLCGYPVSLAQAYWACFAELNSGGTYRDKLLYEGLIYDVGFGKFLVTEKGVELLRRIEDNPLGPLPEVKLQKPVLL